MPLKGWERKLFHYTDDFGRNTVLVFNDYIGDAGGLRRVKPGEPPPMPSYAASAYLKPRRVQMRSLKPDRTGKKSYREIPVQVTSPLWLGPLGQIVVIHDDEYESIKRIPEKERGRMKMLAAMKAQAEAPRRASDS